ncbi:MAG: hypothetical protein HY040_27950 [Planctomycetes bacterium]|nr:hypothetical protein [Planctomycetota bacterium]
MRKVRKLLEKKFPAPDRLELKNEDGIIGTIISNKFNGMESMDRVNMVWDYLDRYLTKEEKRQIVILLTITPKEELLHSS